jgi:hypothetical protein
LIGAENDTDAQVLATANAGDSGGTGVGISVGINVAFNETKAVAGFNSLSGEDSATEVVTFTQGNDLDLRSKGKYALSTRAEGGAVAADGTGVGGGLAITVADNVTEAALADKGGVSVSGDVKFDATHSGTSTTTAKGEAAGVDAAVGAAVALAFVDDSVVATTGSDITAAGAVSLLASGDGASEARAIASAAGTTKAAEGDKGAATW